jgi:methyl-accepting chemotaxis protein
MLSNWKISSRLKLLMAALLALAMLIGGMGWYHSTVTDRALKSLYDDRLVALAQLSVIKERSLHNRLAVTQSAMFPQNHEKYRKEISENAAEITENLDGYMSTYMSAGEKVLADKLLAARKLYLEEALKPAMEAMSSGETAKINTLLESKVRPLYYELKMVVDQLVQLQLDEAQKINNDAAAFTNKMTVVFMIVILGGGTAAIWFGLSIINGINRSITELRGVMVKMAADGDLTVRSKVFGRGEIGQAATAFNSLIDTFAQIIRQVNTSAKSVSGTAAQLTQTSRQIEQGSQTQSEAAATTAAAVEQITVSINSVSANTNDVSKLAEKSLQQTQQGNSNVSTMLGEIQRVQESVNQIADAVQEFVVNIQSISGMTQQVKEIADQTNLLALNAAIEAARAGEQGRGFAVVADEVRKLAEKSGKSASEIDKVTTALNQKSTVVEEMVNNGLRSLNATQEQAARVSGMLKDAGLSVLESTRGVSDIAASVSEQSVASSEIARNVEKIAQMSEENYASVQSNTQDVIQLDKLAKELHDAVSKFKV